MIRVEHIEVFNFEGAIRGLRNPMNSWERSDSKWCHAVTQCKGCEHEDEPLCTNERYIVGENDLDLMHRLYNAGSEHRKYLRQIIVSMDITAPLYWWKEADTYKVGTTSNSCSTMHKIHAKEFTLDDFSHEHLTENSKLTMQVTIDMMNAYRDKYLKDKEREDWWQMIQLLPSSYNQKRTVTMSYENVMNIINQRENHKLDEWKDLVKTLKKLPYIEDIRGGI